MAPFFNWKILLLVATLDVGEFWIKIHFFFKIHQIIMSSNILVFIIVTGKRIKDMIYTSIDNVTACFRRHNGTHQFGCSCE